MRRSYRPEKVSNIYSAVEVWFGLKNPSYGNKCSGGGQPAVLTVFDFIFVLFFSIRRNISFFIEYFPENIEFFPSYGEKQVRKTERYFFAGRKSIALFSENRPFFRGLEKYRSVFRTEFLRKTEKTVIFKVKRDDTPLFFFFAVL